MRSRNSPHDPRVGCVVECHPGTTRSVQGMMSDMTAETFRDATLPQDFATVVDLYLESARYHLELAPNRFQMPERKSLERELTSAWPGLKVILAEASGHPVGLIAGHVLHSTGNGVARTAPTVLRITDVVVRAKARRTGLGAALVDRIEDWGREQGATEITLSVDPSNFAALQLYGRLGYTEARIEMVKTLS